jgi:hypothetical protein
MRNNIKKTTIFIDYPGTEEGMFFKNYKYNEGYNTIKNTQIPVFSPLHQENSKFKLYLYKSDNIKWIYDWMNQIISNSFSYISSDLKIEQKYLRCKGTLYLKDAAGMNITLYCCYPHEVTFLDNEIEIEFRFDHSETYFI